MERSKKVYFDNTLYIDSKVKDSNYTLNNNLVVGTDDSIPPSIYKSILKFNSTNWNFDHIDSIYLFIFLQKIDFKYSYNGNISIVCYPEDISNSDSREEFSKYNSSKRLNLTFPPKAIERYIKIDITNVFSSIYALNKVYNLVLEPYFNPDNESSTSIIEFLSNNSKMPPYLIVNGSMIQVPSNINDNKDLIDFKTSCSDLFDELKILNNSSLDKISSQIECIEKSNIELSNNNKNINDILNSKIMFKNEFYEFMKKYDSNKNLLTTLNENITNNNALISSLKNATEKNNITINKIYDKLNEHTISINNFNNKISTINSLVSSLDDNINENTIFINKLSQKLNNSTAAIDTLIANLKDTDSTISLLLANINNTVNSNEILTKEVNNIKLAINDLITKFVNIDTIISSLDSCSNNTIDMSIEIKSLKNSISSLNNNVQMDKSILKNLNSSIDEILKFTENITLTSLD